MTEVVPDTVEVTCLIDDLPWHVIEAEVELSQVPTPNYVDMRITPDPSVTVPELPDTGDISEIVGAPFYLAADNQLISERRTEAGEDSVLFVGNLANISPIGENTFEAIAYDPSQQPFNIGQDSGSVINMSLNVSEPQVVNPSNVEDLDEEFNGTVQASTIVETIVEFANIPEESYNIRLQDGGYDVGERNIGRDGPIQFQGKYVSVKAALNRVRELTESEWWFDKRGNFYFGAILPDRDVNVHRLKFITDTSAGITTPPYQSVEVVGKGVASSDGWESNSSVQEPSRNIVKRARIAQPTGTVEQPVEQENEGTSQGGVLGTFTGGGEEETEEQEIGDTAQKIIIEDELSQPVFRYVNAEISTQEQAAGTARSILDELIKQQADGEVTLVGFPEITPFDGLQMPGTAGDDTVVNNPARNQAPMGGRQYGVYSVKHRLNASDGFITKVKVSGPTNVTNQALINADDLIADVTVDRRVYSDSDSEYDAVDGIQTSGE